MTYSPFPSEGEPLTGHREVALSKPLYGASMKQAIYRYFAKYSQFKGFASRSEYWWVQLALVMISLIIGFVGAFAGDLINNILQVVFVIVFIVPSLSLSWRRLHDAGFAGPWFFINLIPIIGQMGFLVLTLQPTGERKQKPEWDDPANK